MVNKKSGSSGAKASQAYSEQSIDSQWRNYIASFKRVAKTKAEQNLLDALLSQKTADQLYTKAKPNTAETATLEPAYEPEPVAASSIKPQTISQPLKTPEPLDNTLLLLYFGAFLLVASAGLFVAIGSFDGIIRTLTLGVVAGLLYIGGLWIYQTKKKLKQAGISFMGTGMVITPLVGVAWYNLVAEQTNGAAIWLATSVVCVGLYLHALSRATNDFTAYLLIGSFVSSIESAVLTISLPSYAFAWGLILASLILQFAKIKESESLRSAQNSSAQLLVPLSILGSLVLLPEFGNTQLAITLLLASGFYALQAWQQTSQRLSYATASQISAISAVANLAYGFSDHVWAIGLSLGTIATIYTLAIATLKLDTLAQYNVVNIGMLASVVGIALAIPEGWSLVACSSVGIMLSLTIWLRTKSHDALSIASILALALPLIIGQYALADQAGVLLQLAMSAVPAVLFGCLVLYSNLKASYADFYDIASLFYTTSTVALVIIAWLGSFMTLFITSLVLAASYILIFYGSKHSDWWVLAGCILLTPVADAWFTFGAADMLFSVTVALALAINIAISLKTREPTIRWLVVLCILLSPIALGEGGLGMNWDEAAYAGGYLLAMAACVLARAIARGKLLVSSKVPLSSYDDKASQAYIVGYIITGSIAFVVSLYDDHSQAVTTLVLGAISATLLYVVHKIESDNHALVLLPLLLQSMLLSGIRPDLQDSMLTGFTALLCSTLAAVMYGTILLGTDKTKPINKSLLSVSTYTAYLGPMFVFVHNDHSLFMPASLAVAGALTYYHNRSESQSNKELSVGVVIAAIHWFLYLNNVHNIHIHAHLLALFFAGFAYWRSLLGDKSGSNGYIQALFWTATIPLGLQALDGESGSNYGLLLIVQQIFFMLIGAMLNLRFLLKAGMWVALIAILYQLRGLGWAFLSLLAIILIGIAIYRLQKHEE